MPSVRAASEDSDTPHARGDQVSNGSGRTPVGLADHHDRLPRNTEFVGPLGHGSE